MKICVVAYKFGTEVELGEHLGSYHYFIEKMRTLVRLGHQVFVIAPWLEFHRRGSADVSGVKVLRYYPPLFNRPKLFFFNKLLRVWYIKATQATVLELDREVNLDAVYVWQARETGYAVARIAHLLRAPFIFRQITAWEWHFQRSRFDRKAQMKFARAIYAKANTVVFVSKAASQEGLRAGLRADKIAIIGIGIETDLFRRVGKSREWREKLSVRGEKIILFIGRINFAEKGIGFLLSALPDIIKAVPGVNLVIIGGGGESERIRKLIESLAIGSHVQLVGQQSFARLPEYLNAADVLVVPSVWSEHFGQVTIEAMSAGVPVVTSDVGGLPEINLHGETGLVVPSANSGAIAEAVIRLLRDEQLQKQYGSAGRRRVQENYTYEVLVKKFLEIIKNAANSK